MFSWIILRAMNAIFLFSLLLSGAVADISAPNVRISGAESVIARGGCDLQDVPDAPARAFRGRSGQISLIASHVRTRRLVGRHLGSLHKECSVVLQGDDSPRVEDLNSLLWVVSTWTDDGDTVHALIHNEYRGKRYGNCLVSTSIGCWYNTILYAVSHDGGERFSLAPHDKRLVAGLSTAYDPSYRSNVGFFNPSNILKSGEFHYFFAFTSGDRSQPRGSCLFRTKDVSDPTSWRVWDGENFESRLRAAYYGVRDGGGVRCAPVKFEGVNGPIYSILADRSSGAFIAVAVASRWDAVQNSKVEYIAAFSSFDLVKWSPPALLQHVEVLSNEPCENRTRLYYPSLISDDAEGRNFDQLNREASLIVTRTKLDKNCRPTLSRELVSIPVRFGVD